MMILIINADNVQTVSVTSPLMIATPAKKNTTSKTKNVKNALQAAMNAQTAKPAPNAPHISFLNKENAHVKAVTIYQINNV